jgi:hypothetical protein
MSVIHMKSRELALSVPQTIREHLCDRLGEAISALRGRLLSGARLHRTWKNLTRARACLRLLRPCIGDRNYRRYNTRVRFRRAKQHATDGRLHEWRK